MKFFIKILSFIVVIIIVTAIDVAFLPSLGPLFISLNLTLSLALYLMIIVNREYSLILFVFSAVLAGITGSQLMFTPIIIGVFVLLLIDWLFESFFTNRSYYTLLALGLIGWFAYYLLFGLVVLSMSAFSTGSILPRISLAYIATTFFGAIFLLLILSSSYIFTTLFSKKFKSYFIIAE